LALDIYDILGALAAICSVLVLSGRHRLTLQIESRFASQRNVYEFITPRYATSIYKLHIISHFRVESHHQKYR
jgi:hypothetical protein